MARASATTMTRERRGGRYTRRVAAGLLACWIAGALGSAWAQNPSIVLSRNLFFNRTERPSATLAGGASLSLGPERVDAGTPARLRLVSPTALVSAAFNFRPAPDAPDAWVLTVFITTQKKEREFYYLSQGQRALQGKLLAQTDYYANGLETELSAADADGQMRQVREIVLQDDGQAELRVALDGDALQLTVLPPKFGGTTNPPRFPGGKGPPLRFLDYQMLVGGYTDNGFGEIWIQDVVVLRGNYLTNDNETRTVGRAALTYQVWRWEHFSVCLEAGAFLSQQRDEKAGVTHDAKYGLAAGVTSHWRYKAFGAGLHLGSAGGPLVAQVLGGWQVAERWGLLASWQQVKESSGFGIGGSVNW